MDTVIVWIIIVLFYAPLHYLAPLLVVFLRDADQDESRRKDLTTTAIDCTLSMVIAFALVIALADRNMQTAMLILLGSMFLPYLRLLLTRRPTPAVDAEGDQSRD